MSRIYFMWFYFSCDFSLLLVMQSFFEGQSASWDVAKKEQNRTKNRYGNIIACKQKQGVLLRPLF